jgi:hypothetical protein
VCSLLFLTTPGIAHWSRDTMSEVPSLVFALAGTALFLAWLRQGGAWRCWLAFALALVGFFSRVTMAGILPGWFLFALAIGKGRQMLSRHVILSAAGYLSASVAWVSFAARFSRFEMAADGKSEGFSSRNLDFFVEVMPEILVWGTVLAGLAGLVCLICCGKKAAAGLFWACWLLSYFGFKLAMPTTSEPRHFFAAFPAFAGLAACLFAFQDGESRPASPARRVLPLVGVAGALVVNLYFLWQIPAGVIGYDAPARRLAELDRQGNVLLACWEDQEIIFRYRTWPSAVKRRMVRADRTLAIRVADYARRDPEIRAHTHEDVLDIIYRGRIRYVVTCTPTEAKKDDRTEEMILAHDTIVSRPDRFALVGAYPVLIQFGGRGRSGQLHLWENKGELPDTPSELPVEIPTARMVIGQPQK